MVRAILGFRALAVWVLGFAPQSVRRPRRRRRKPAFDRRALIISGALGAAALALVIGVSVSLNANRPPRPAGNKAPKALLDDATARAAEFRQLEGSLRVRFADRDGTRLMKAWTNRTGSSLCGYYARPGANGRADPERFVAVGPYLVAEDDAAADQFSKLWLIHCADEDYEVR